MATGLISSCLHQPESKRNNIIPPDKVGSGSKVVFKASKWLNKFHFKNGQVSQYKSGIISLKGFQGINHNSSLNTVRLWPKPLFSPSLTKRNKGYLNRLFLFTLARYEKISIFAYTPCSYLYQRLLSKESHCLSKILTLTKINANHRASNQKRQNWGTSRVLVISTYTGK